MMAGNPSNWWSMAEHHHLHNPEPPHSQSWSQLLLGGFPEGDEDKLVLSNQFQPKKLENLEGRILIPFPRLPVSDVMKNEELLAISSQKRPSSASSSSSSVTSFFSSNSMLDFSYNRVDSKTHAHDHHYSSDQSASSTASGGVCKKARVQPNSGQPPIKARKEKVGDRITALHQLVSPFGKTDTASVLSEAIGYVRFLQSQIEALISPYLGSSSKTMSSEQFVQSERRTSVFPEDPGQLLNDSSLKRKLAPYQEGEDEAKDLRSRGLCLVPVSCTQHVESDINGAHYWAQPYTL